jgi:hypothetical protein
MMRHSPYLHIAALVAMACAPVVAAQDTPHSHSHEVKAYGVPESMRREHAEIHAALERATKEPGRVGVAARELVEVLHPHFVREEQIALPPLGLLAPLARGELTAGVDAVLPLTDSLRAEMPRMLEEHKAIREATKRLGEAAKAAGNLAVARLAESLALHAQNEEEVTYPAAIVVGDLLRLRVRAPGASEDNGSCRHHEKKHAQR